MLAAISAAENGEYSSSVNHPL